ncbi:MAG: tRNA (5-methylaminomethyl-2-thiouridine)(34)-methyltransferase MnmD [Saprospiraceae bacterium]|nr:tRNA (5-methylaminomethyl-2-thiouridine)(34)-methyltransferase MnmD [Saprospiraceae bacterium]
MSVITSNDGSHTILSGQFGVTYHSTHGAITESEHVFIAAGLQHQTTRLRQISILETGFGTGLNAFMTWLEAEKSQIQVSYTALEIFPVTAETAGALNYPEMLGCPERIPDFMRLHTADWEIPHSFSPYFELTKRRMSIEHFEEESAFDVVYFDAFAPQAQPELWTPEVFGRMFRSLRPEGVLVTYCAQGEFKRSLKKAGFTVERLPGPPGKREMTRATVQRQV